MTPGPRHAEGHPRNSYVGRLGDVMRTSHGGRKSKGERVLLGSRVPTAFGDAVRENAEREGYDSVSDYIAAVLAHHQGMPEFAPVPVRDQEELPLQRVS